jgi:hypothetical protein
VCSTCFIALSRLAKARNPVIYGNVVPYVNENLVFFKSLLANTVYGSVCGRLGAPEIDVETCLQKLGRPRARQH